MNWTLLDPPARARFLDLVKNDDVAPLMSGPMIEVKYLPLAFYHTMRLYRVTNFASMPIMSLHYLSDGTRSFYLDGTDDTLATIGGMGDLKLTAGNVLAYLHFYFFAVVMNEGEVFLVQDPGAYPYQDQSADSFAPRFTFAPGGPSYTITPQSDGGFAVDTPLFIDGTLTRANVHVDVRGHVRILDYRMMVQTGDTAAGATTFP